MKRLSELYENILKQYHTPKIVHPIFYSYPHALRFELANPDESTEEKYISSAMERATILFNTIFEASKELLVMIDWTPDKKLKEAFCIAKMQRCRVRTLSPFDGEDDPEDSIRYHYRYYYQLRANQLPQELLFDRIIQGSLADAVYIFDLQNSMMFYIYDDRGADLIAPEKEILIPFFTSLNPYLLDYNRLAMNENFHS